MRIYRLGGAARRELVVTCLNLLLVAAAGLWLFERLWGGARNTPLIWAGIGLTGLAMMLWPVVAWRLLVIADSRYFIDCFGVHYGSMGTMRHYAGVRAVVVHSPSGGDQSVIIAAAASSEFTAAQPERLPLWRGISGRRRLLQNLQQGWCEPVAIDDRAPSTTAE